MRFEWDDAKSRLNESKHQVDFETATLVFDDPLHVSLLDRGERGEERWKTIGLVNGSVLLFVAHSTWEEGDEQVVRIISARGATPMERKRYEEGHA